MRPASSPAGSTRAPGPRRTSHRAPTGPGSRANCCGTRFIRRRLDLRSGLLRQVLDLEDSTLTALQFSSLARPGTVALRGAAAELPPSDRRTERGGLVAAIGERRSGDRFDRIATYRPDESGARAALAEAERAGFERLLAEHREASARRWETADVVVEGDAQVQRDVRFALFHLIASVADEGEAAVGARGLSGHAYRGHVFWDSDVFVLPFLAATRPRRTGDAGVSAAPPPAAREAARRLGGRGARFPWESAADGVDVTPASARDPRPAALIRIRTGSSRNTSSPTSPGRQPPTSTGAATRLRGRPRRAFIETARYWASRIRVENGRGTSTA